MNKIFRGSLSRLLCVFFLLCIPASAQGLKVRVINATNGQPLAQQGVLVNLIYEKKENAPSNIEWSLHLTTGADGTVSFPIPVPAPEHLWIQVKLTLDKWRCACYALAVTQDVLRKGLVPEGSLKTPSSAAARAQRGEILFTARPPTFFERVFEPILRE